MLMTAVSDDFFPCKVGDNRLDVGDWFEILKINLGYWKKGYSHVGDIVMLMTYSWWLFKNVSARRQNRHQHLQIVTTSM